MVLGMLGALISGWKTAGRLRVWLWVPATMFLIIWAITPTVFWPMIHQLYGTATGKIVASDAESIRLAQRWIICDWFRVGLIAIGFVSSVKAISIVTAAEMRFGAFNDNWGARKLQLLETHLQTYVQIPIDDATALEWGRLRDACQRRGFTQRDNDLWIAATALQYGLTLAARDQHFAWIAGFAFEQW